MPVAMWKSNLAGCWAEALRQMAYMAKILGDEEEAESYNSEFKNVVDNLDKQFWNSKTEFYDAGLCFGSDNKTEKTVLPAIPIFFGHLPFEKSQSAAEEFSTEDFSEAWGVTIVTRKSPDYDGGRSQYGCVWPLFTGWASLAEYKTHLPVGGFQHIMANLRNYRQGSLGWVEEILHGNTGKPAGVCPHQAWSEAMVCLPILRGMLGLEADAIENAARMCHHIPKQWDRFEVTNIRIGDNTLNWEYRKTPSEERYRFKWTGKNPLSLEFEPPIPDEFDKVELKVNGKQRYLATKKYVRCSHALIFLNIRRVAMVTLNFTT